ncbi:MAG: hypothetical protein ACRC17_09520 [Culicoidibacterales bacterium]
MEYTSRVQRRKQRQQQNLKTQDGVAELIDLEITKEMPITVQLPIDSTQIGMRQTNRQQKKINELVTEMNPLPEQQLVDDTNLEILKKITIVTPPQTLADDLEYEQAATKFSEAAQQLNALISDLQKNKRKKTTLAKSSNQSTNASVNHNHSMFDLELAQTQELPVFSQFHSQINEELVATKALEVELNEIEATKLVVVTESDESTIKHESAAEIGENAEELTFDYKKMSEDASEMAEKSENKQELAEQIAKDRFINKILIATLIFLSVAVIITLGIGLSIIFLNQNSLG